MKLIILGRKKDSMTNPRVLEMDSGFCRFVGTIVSQGYPTVSIYVPAEVRKALKLKAKDQTMVTIELM